jgi:uncharacterized membrane protein
MNRPSSAKGLAIAAAVGGALLLAYAARKTGLLRPSAVRTSIDFTKSVHIDAPVDQVFSFWSDFENFPRFMRNVRGVRKNRDDTWHWTVAGPLGSEVEWDARVTQYIPGQVIAWATNPGALVEHSGIVRVQPHEGGTHLHIRVSYRPPLGALGHAVAALFGADPQSEMDEDLARVKAFFARRSAPAVQTPAQLGR